MTTNLMTTQPRAITQKRPRRSQANRVGLLPARSDLADQRTPCRQCGATPTKLVRRGNMAVERACYTCGHIQFLDAPDLAL